MAAAGIPEYNIFIKVTIQNTNLLPCTPRYVTVRCGAVVVRFCTFVSFVGGGKLEKRLATERVERRVTAYKPLMLPRGWFFAKAVIYWAMLMLREIGVVSS